VSWLTSPDSLTLLTVIVTEANVHPVRFSHSRRRRTCLPKTKRIDCWSLPNRLRNLIDLTRLQMLIPNAQLPERLVIGDLNFEQRTASMNTQAEKEHGTALVLRPPVHRIALKVTPNAGHS
jgi:hypothetical protein